MIAGDDAVTYWSYTWQLKPALGKSPATMRIPYKKLFGFVSVAGLMPTATQSKQGAMSPNDKRFTEGVTIYNTTIKSGETWAVPQLDQRAIYLITLSFRGTDAEHMSTYILHQNSEYAKNVQQISLFNYQSNTSVSVVKNDNGTYGIKIIPTFPNLGGGGLKLTYRILSTRT